MEGYTMSLNDELKDNDLKSMALSDDDLEGVAGGMDIFGMKAICMKTDCHNTIFIDFRNPIPPERCPRCGYKMRIVDMS